MLVGADEVEVTTDPANVEVRSADCRRLDYAYFRADLADGSGGNLLVVDVHEGRCVLAMQGLDKKRAARFYDCSEYRGIGEDSATKISDHSACVSINVRGEKVAN